MNFGYLIFVSSAKENSYESLAYSLALSIKNTQKPGYDKVALVIDDKTLLNKFKSLWVFDHIIEWNQETFWDGRSWMDKLSPFDATVCLDADMLFLEDHSHWIDYFIENSELYIANKSYTYRNEIVTSSFYRNAFVKNDLPNLYSFYTFFKKDSELATEFFKLGRYIIKHPIEFSNLFLLELKPKVVGTDEAFALSAKILGIEDQIAYNLDFPKVIHIKGRVQNTGTEIDDWTNHLGFYFNLDGKLKIANYQQHNIVHYVEKNKFTTELITKLQGVAWNK
jgi:hypothetical protein